MTEEMWVELGLPLTGVAVGAFGVLCFQMIWRNIRASKENMKAWRKAFSSMGMRIRDWNKIAEGFEIRLTNLEHPPYENPDCEHDWSYTLRGEVCVQCGLTREKKGKK